MTVRLFWSSAVVAIWLFGSQSATAESDMHEIITLRLAREPGAFQPQQVFHSPRKSRVAIITNYGEVDRNIRRYDLDLFDVAACQAACERRRLSSVEVSGNDPGISRVVWRDESHLIYLRVGENGQSQVYGFDLNSGQEVQLSHGPYGVRGLAVAGDALAFIEAGTEKPLWSDAREAEKGIVVGQQGLTSLLRNRSGSGASDAPGIGDLFVSKGGKIRRLDLGGSADWLPETLSVSQRGDVTLLRREPRNQLPWVKSQNNAPPLSGNVLTLWGAEEGALSLRRLVDRSVGPGGGAVAWAPDGRQFALATLNPEGAPETVSVRLEGKTDVERIDTRCLPLEFQTSERLLCRDVGGRTDGLWEKRAGRWVAVSRGPISRDPAFIDEAFDHPPALRMRLPAGGTRVLWDLNPGFKTGIHVTQETFKLPGSGRIIQTGVYWPQGYAAGRRYPVVIQTHGWDPTTFQPEGLSSAGYAASSLSERGFLVVQLPDLPMPPRSEEGRAYSDYFDAVIDKLIERGVADATRIGLQGWSRAGFAVRAALQSGRHKYGAAVLVDSMSGGYMSWLAAENLSASYQATVAELNGGKTTDAPANWVLNSPPIKSAGTPTPVLLQVFGAPSLVGAWEDFVVKRRAKVPVELRYYPDAMHNPRKPAERLAIMQSTVDWYTQWLLTAVRESKTSATSGDKP
jgi:dipeptidyl aminopeptidase/acylaminoacyl peptidase